MVDLNRAHYGIMSPREFLTEPSSDEISLLKVGAASDPHSLIALYRSDGRDETVRSPNQLDGFLAVIIFQNMKEFTLRRNRKALQIPRSVRGATGLHDLRNDWSSPKYPVFSMNFVFSSAFLGDLPAGNGYQGMDWLRDAPAYGNHDQTLLHLASALLPAFAQPAQANRLFVDQVFLAAGIHLISKHRSQQPLESLRGGTTPYRWFIEQRLAQSKSLLESTSDELSEIALACGFADQSHFTRTFSRFVGHSPAVWRRLQSA